MDYASLTDSQQLYQQYQQHQLQQQSQTQPYDPSLSQSQPQPQSYDQAYYHYYQQQQQQQQYQPYYQQDYYHQQNDSTPIQPPGVSAPDPLPPLHQHNPYYPTEQQPQHPVPYGLNPAAAAAVAALSQLTQFAGTMDAAERAMAGMHDRQWPGKYGPGGGGGGGPMPMDMPPYMAPPPHHGPYPGHRVHKSCIAFGAIKAATEASAAFLSPIFLCGREVQN